MAERQTLILICGIGEDEAVWAPISAMLGDVATCRAMVAAGDDIDAMARDILAQTSGPIAVAGHSLGGYVAMGVQRAAPGRVTRLALLNTSALPDDEAGRANRRRVIERIARDGYPAVVRAILPALGDVTPRHPAVDEAEAMLLRTGEVRFARDQHAAMTRPDARPGLAALRVPLLVIAGALDQVIPSGRSVEIAAAVPRATLVVLPQSGHLSPIETPVAIATALRAWLARSEAHLP